jgi:hypothetical protein
MHAVTTTKLSDPRAERLRRENSDFEELCSDYEICVQTLARMSADPITDTERLCEYRSLKAELEAEIDEFLATQG